MSRYSYIQDPAALTSPVTGAATRLVPVPSYGSQMAIPVAAAAVPAAGATARGLGAAFLSDFLANLASGAVQAGTSGAAGALAPPTSGGGSGGKFMITLADVRDIQQYVNNENFKRRMLGLEELDANEIIRDREAQLRRSAAEAGAREYAIEQLKQQGAVQSSLGQSVGQGLSSTGGVLQQSIASTMARPDYSSIISELGRAF